MKILIKIPTLSFLLLCFVLSDSGAEQVQTLLEKDSIRELTWEDCIKEAKKNNPDLVSAQEKLNQVMADKSIALSTILPQISTDLSGKTSKTYSAERTDRYSYGISIRQLLFDGFKTFYDIARANRDVRTSFFSYQEESSDIRLRLRYAFVGLLKTRELLSITEDIAKRRQKNLELIKLRYEAGREHKGALLMAEANLAQAEFEVVQARRSIRVAQRRLAKELGWIKLVPVVVKGDLEIENLHTEKPDFEIIAGQTPLLKELILRKEAVRFGLKSAKADFLPEVYANAGAGRTDTRWPPDRDEWSAGISVTFPIFSGGSRIARVRKAEAVLAQAQADQRSGRDGVILALEETWTDLQDSLDEVKVQKKFLAAAQERAKIGDAQYSTGLLSFDNWIIIEDELVRVEKLYLEVQINALIAKALWIQAKGGTLDYEEE